MRWLLPLLAVVACSGSMSVYVPQTVSGPMRSLSVLVDDGGMEENGSVARAALEAALLQAGYQVVTESSRPHDLVARVRGRITFNYDNEPVWYSGSIAYEHDGMIVATGSGDDPWFASDRAGWLVDVLTRSERAAALAAAPARAEPLAPVQSPPPPAAPASVVVAVFDVEDSSGAFDAAMLSQLTEYLAVKATEALGYRIVPREQLRARLVEEKAGSYRACIDESCQIELGKAVAAEKSLATKLIRVGPVCAVTATIYDLRTETTELASSAKTACDDSGLIAGIDQLILQMRERAGP